MTHDMAQNASEWRLAAESTFSGAMELFRSKNTFVLFPAAILPHHALEQVLKSALIRAGYSIGKGRHEDGFAWGHELVILAQHLASKRRDFPLEIFKDLAVFDAFFDELRYPQAVEKVECLGYEEGILLSHVMQCVRPFAAPLRNPFTGENIH